jgi:subtilisin family serine protease
MYDLIGLSGVVMVKIYSDTTFICYATSKQQHKFKSQNSDKIMIEVDQIIKIDDPVYADSLSFSASNQQLEAFMERIGGNDSQVRSNRQLYPYPENLYIFVLDTGIARHRDLNINEILSRNFVPVPNTEIIDTTDWADRNFVGHGTHVAGTIGGRNESFGVAPGVRVIAHKVLGDDGSGRTSYQVESLTAIQNFKRQNTNAQILVNMSLGISVRECTQTDPFYTLIRELTDTGVTIIVSAGNSTHNVSVHSPARIPSAITVGAYAYERPTVLNPNGNRIGAGLNNRISTFSNYGRGVDIMAPGVGIYSTNLNNQYLRLNGTSMSTPVVTGAVALMLTRQANTNSNTTLNPQQIKDKLRQDAFNSFNNSRNPEIIMENTMFSLCWELPTSRFSERHCNIRWNNPSGRFDNPYQNTCPRPNGNNDAYQHTYPYGLYIGSYVKDGETIQNY